MNVITTNGDRWYEKDGRWLPSVTTIIGRYLNIGPKDEEARARWDQLAKRGSRIHDLLAKPHISRGEWDQLPKDIRYALHARQRFVDAYGFRRENCELALASVELGFAGRLDDAGRIPEGRILVDYKSGRLRLRSLRPQLGAYYGLYVARYPRRKIFGALGVGLSPVNGDYIVESLSLGDLKRGLSEFKKAKQEVENDTNSWAIRDKTSPANGQDTARSEAAGEVGG